eukprot:9485010-Pyramimonas_sp.AAC.2
MGSQGGPDSWDLEAMLFDIQASGAEAPQSGDSDFKPEVIPPSPEAAPRQRSQSPGPGSARS